jgi:GH24 family phage-related lysozyme (muramidase)
MSKKSNTLIYLAIGAGLLFFFSGNSADAAGITSAGISNNQLQSTINYESFSATAYPDGSNGSTQLYSIGYGHQIGTNELSLLTGSITKAQAQNYLLQDMAAVVAVINNFGQSFTQGQIDALADFGYSAGIGALNLVLAIFAASGADAATAEMSQYVYWHPTPGGPAVLNNTLVSRRNAEVATFNS